ncbi:serum response factor homolog isoform X2 [Ischnura elegans]|uniref:serum response factor homolog isoform X2 n=1 Tax=Ischnura elegans TaxID=197161 RepID=UPI001ED86914|nr:serum response factor homolog isoform X2 [Ischnura elegans]
MSYNMSLLSGSETSPDMYGHGNSGNSRPSTSLGVTRSGIATPVSCSGQGGVQRSLKRSSSDAEFDQNVVSAQQQSGMGLVGECVGTPDISDDAFSQSHQKKTPPPNGKKTKGRVKIKMEYIDNKLRRYTTFSKRKTGIMKKAYELSTLTGTQVMLLVASETGHVYTFATRKLQPMITSEAGKALIQTCLNSPDPPPSAAHHPDQRMSATGFEETELTYNIAEEEQKEQAQGGGLRGSHGGSFQDSSPSSPAGSEDAADSSGNEEAALSPQPSSPASDSVVIKEEMGRGDDEDQPSQNTPVSSTPEFVTVMAAARPQFITASAAARVMAGGGFPSSTPGVLYQTAQGMVYAAHTTAGGTATTAAHLIPTSSPLANGATGLILSLAPSSHGASPSEAAAIAAAALSGSAQANGSRSHQQFIRIPLPALSASQQHDRTNFSKGRK